MKNPFKKLRGDKKGWYKVSDLRPGIEIAVPSKTGNVMWDEIVSITPVGREHVYDIEVEGTHNFVGNGIFAHNTYVLRANTMLAVEGEVNAGEFVVPVPTLPVSDGLPSATSTLLSQLPPEVLTADGKGVDLYKLSTYNLAVGNALAARMNAEDVRVTSLEDRMAKLESGAIGTGTSTPFSLGTTSLASAFNAFGAYISKGIAQFGTLVADQFVAATNSAGTSSAGTVTVLAGNKVAQVNNAYVLPTTKIFVTFTASTTGSWYISDKQNGSFKVVLEQAPTTDTSFDYFLVQTEGQIATSTPESLSGPTPKSDLGVGPLSSAAPVITMLGDSVVHVSMNNWFIEPGVHATDAVDGNITVDTYINGVKAQISSTTVDTSHAATYTITYKATNSAGVTATATRTVIIDDPNGSTSLTTGGNTASSTLPTPGVGAPTGSVGAASGDTTPPVVTLNGAAAMEMTVGGTFTDPGATALDETDGDLTNHINVSGTVDAATAGLYTLTYSATDAALNEGHVSRVVSVVASTTDSTASSTPLVP